MCLSERAVHTCKACAKSCWGILFFQKMLSDIVYKKASIEMEQVDLVAHYCDFQQEGYYPPIESVAAIFFRRRYQKGRSLLSVNYMSWMLCGESVLNQFEKITGVRPKSFMPCPATMKLMQPVRFLSQDSDPIPDSDPRRYRGVGEFPPLEEGHDSKIAEIWPTFLPTSLGTLYLIITVFLGFPRAWMMSTK